MDWEDIKHLAAFAEQGSLSAASRVLGVDHATVGRRIAALERTLGLELLDRRGSRITLSKAGRLAADAALRVDAEAQSLLRQTRAMHAPVSGEVRVSAPPGLASHFLAPRLAPLRTLHPALHLELAGETSAASLGRREADIAIRLSRPLERSVAVRRIGSMSFGLFATAGYLRRREEAAWEFVGFDKELDGVAQERWLRESAGSRPVVFRANDLAIQIAAVRAGMGIGALPWFMAGADPLLVSIAAAKELRREIWLIVHTDLRRTPAIRAVLDFLGRIFREGRPVLDPPTTGDTAEVAPEDLRPDRNRSG